MIPFFATKSKPIPHMKEKFTFDFCFYFTEKRAVLQ